MSADMGFHRGIGSGDQGTGEVWMALRAGMCSDYVLQ